MEDCRRHARENDWTVVDELVDDGISAFKGAHANTGRLGQFVRDVDTGKYPDGVVLLCEKLDRLSRQEPGRVFLWMMELTEAGVVVATVDGARRYSKGNFDMATIIEVVVKAQLSHEESEKKSQRLAAAWAAKRKRLDGGEKFVMSRRAPAWLEVSGTPPEFQLVPERATVVRRIFAETIAGFGKHHIAKNLNEDGVPTFGRAEAWHASYIQKVLNNPAVLGEFQPHQKARGEKREPIGDVIKGYYPPVIDAEVHRRAMASMAERSRRVAGKGRKLVNLFAGVARCGECGEKMTFRGKGKKQRADGTWVDEDYLVCDGYQRGRGCQNHIHYNYRDWAGAALTPFFNVAFSNDDMLADGEAHDVEIAIAELERDLEGHKKLANAAMKLAIRTERKEARAEWLALAEASDQLEIELTKLRERLIALRGEPTPEEHHRFITGFRALLEHEDEHRRHEARSRMMAAIHSLVESMHFLKEPRQAFMRLKGGHTVTIEHRSDTNQLHGTIDHPRAQN